MNCDESRELMLDVVYGEEIQSRACFDFFRHVDGCPECGGEYRELLTTREMLHDWEVEEPDVASAPEPSPARPWMQKPHSRFGLGPWWLMLQKVAAGFLIVVGVVSIFQHYGYLGGRKLLVSEKQLAEMVQDMIVVNQTQERHLIGQALIAFREDVEAQRTQDMQDVHNSLVTLEQRYTDNLEENNRYLKALLAR